MKVLGANNMFGSDRFKTSAGAYSAKAILGDELKNPSNYLTELAAKARQKNAFHQNIDTRHNIIHGQQASRNADYGTVVQNSINRVAFDKQINDDFINNRTKHFKNQLYPRPEETFDEPIRKIRPVLLE